MNNHFIAPISKSWQPLLNCSRRLNEKRMVNKILSFTRLYFLFVYRFISDWSPNHDVRDGHIMVKWICAKSYQFVCWPSWCMVVFSIRKAVMSFCSVCDWTRLFCIECSVVLCVHCMIVFRTMPDPNYVIIIYSKNYIQYLKFRLLTSKHLNWRYNSLHSNDNVNTIWMLYNP